MKTLCIYHGNCADGFAAAWVVRQALIRGEGEQVEFYAGKYSEPPPDVTGKNVIMVDFSYPRPVMEQIIWHAAQVTILDHHVSAQNDLAGMVGIRAVFDSSRSGARLAWDYFYPAHMAPPELLLHIEDRDLWRFRLPQTREIMAAVFSHPYDFDTWDELMGAEIQTLAAEGAVLERAHSKTLTELLEATTRKMRIAGHVVPCANLPYTMASDGGHRLALHAPFAACYWDSPKGRHFSLRSTDGGEDVSEIAKTYGGGGHRTAAGFIVSFDLAREFEI